MLKEIKCLVSGRVQGVMYRDFVKRQARWRELTGTVENLKDGRVRVVACGDQAPLREFVERLKRGSLFSRVDSVDVEWRDGGETLDQFRIIL